jgi:hypothetical protein
LKNVKAWELNRIAPMRLNRSALLAAAKEFEPHTKSNGIAPIPSRHYS